MIKPFIKKYFSHFSYFYTQLRSRMLVAFVLSMAVGLLDGLGLAMFLPLLQMIDGRTGKAEGLGSLDFLVKGMSGWGIPLTLTSVLGVMVLFFVLKAIFKFTEGVYNVYLQRYFIRKLRFANVDLLVHYSYKHFVLSDSGKIQNTISGEVERIISAYRNYFMAMQAACMVLVYVILALSVNAQFTLLVLIGGLLTNGIYSTIYKKTKSLSKRLTQSSHGFQGLLIQKVAFFKYLKATGMLNDYGKKLKSQIIDIEQSQKKIGVLNALLNAIREPIILLIMVAVILIEVEWLGGSLSLIILSLLFFYRALTYVLGLQNYWNSFLANHGSLVNMQEFMAELSTGREQQGAHHMRAFSSAMVFDKVGFSYGKRAVLSNISFKLAKNQTLALVGESGSGKTSLMNLMAGLALPDGGELYIDGVPIRNIDRASFQRRIGYITQEPVIFSDTIFNNVTFWDAPTAANKARFYVALQKAAVYDFVMGLEGREEALLGNNGIMVSGGQKQRISIARELYKEVDILLMDEATSALDSETERVIKENIEALKGHYTIVIIAHRLSTVRNADQIILLRAGQIDRIGTFEELLQHSLTFKKMVELQEF
ncbi:MAG TPA: ABC transporter ATP-binding protein [Cyclobacteriaceae bacterium]|nr:ABC transporter ATP-binding protein [Cyclobacteriaceae bacterium]